MNKIRNIFLALAATALVAACGKPQPIGQSSGTTVAELSSLPAPGAQDYAAGRQDDQARPLDILTVAVFGVPELSHTMRVGAGGFIDYPLIGAVQANGRTLAEIGFEIETRLKGTYVRNPDVTVEFGERAGQVLTVGGEVMRPGLVPIIQNTTLMEAVAMAGGRTTYSRLTEVLVFREIGGQRYIGVYDVAAIQRGNYADPQVYPHDIIMVGDSPNRRMMADVLQYTQLLTSPLILLQQVVGN
ncbi:MAG: polysaccharide biosynthesis/export family protein [Pseudomonadota bacterium]